MTKFHRPAPFLSLLAAVLLTACAATETASSFWQDSGFTPVPVATDRFTIYTAQKITRPTQDIAVYIEGDGHAWVSRHQPSTNPTPRISLVRNWALQDPRPNVVYMARPCQYIGMMDEPCAPSFWLEKRFAEEIVASMSQALDRLKHKTPTARLHLIGYSGGGAIAALLAQRRDDVVSLTTVAGNLDPDLHSRLHQVSPLEGLNPRDNAAKLTMLRQTHYVGGHDTNVPPSIAQSFVDALPDASAARIVVLPQATHDDDWNDLAF